VVFGCDPVAGNKGFRATMSMYTKGGLYKERRIAKAIRENRKKIIGESEGEVFVKPVWHERARISLAVLAAF